MREMTMETFYIINQIYCIVFVFLFCILFLLHHIDNSFVVKHQLVQGCLNYVYYSLLFIKTQTRTHANPQAHKQEIILS